MAELLILPQCVKTPKSSQQLERGLRPINDFFDWLYHSRYNPLYRSGRLAISCLFILLASGTYLICFYSVAKPHESLQALEQGFGLGSFMRSLHRYATDLALLACFFHILQILSQGKTWGPRFLAWTSGVCLLGLLFVSAWTGYVMVWDQHGQALALAGAGIIQLLPILRDPIAQAFSGSTPLPASFFFTNLFLHVALPLMMFVGFWIHTSRLARAQWIPSRNILIGLVIAVSALALIYPAGLGPAADLSRLITQTWTDIFFSFWIFWNPFWAAFFWSALFALLFSVPFFWKPARHERSAPSSVDPELCSGCTQCLHDCPFEAISMLPHPAGKRLLAHVNPNYCVSCGICVASCADLAIGPQSRGPNEKLQALRDALGQLQHLAAEKKLLVMACVHNLGMLEALQSFAANHPGTYLHAVDCCGTIHSAGIEMVLESFPKLGIVACPQGNCLNRDGLTLLSERIFEKRVPFIAKHIDRSRITICALSACENNELSKTLENSLARTQNTGTTLAVKSASWLSTTKRLTASALLLLALGFLSQLYFGSETTSAVLRINAVLPAISKENCRPLTTEEKSKLPLHMQKPEICETASVKYELQINSGQNTMVRKIYEPAGVRGDSPIFINQDLALQPGTYELEVKLLPLSGDLVPIEWRGKLSLSSAQIALLIYEHQTQSLALNSARLNKLSDT